MIISFPADAVSWIKPNYKYSNRPIESKQLPGKFTDLRGTKSEKSCLKAKVGRFYRP